MPDNKAPSVTIDWSQWVCPGPRRVFSADEMARAGSQPWPKVIDGYVLSNVVVLLAINYNTIARGLAFLISVGVLLSSWLALKIAAWLWRQPTRRNLNVATLSVAGLTLCLALWIKGQHLDRSRIEVPMLILLTSVVVSLTAWWFLTIYRVQQIEARLRELADQAHGLQLARRLATAQIQPHFLFNTLASLQHWVDTQDPRAGPTLRSFTRYLRATLPMFERESVSLAEELQMVRSYLEIMQARLGARLTWEVQADPALDPLPLPPGLLLTLVENAIGHGIEPALRGGRIEVRARRVGPQVQLEVQDDGAGLAEPLPEGVGLANTRERLKQLYGAEAQLTLSAAEPGCLARITLPWEPTTP